MTILAQTALAFVIGFIQSLVFGACFVRRWDGGHGFLWGTVFAIVALPLAWWLESSTYIATVSLGVAVLGVHVVAMWRHERRLSQKQ